MKRSSSRDIRRRLHDMHWPLVAVVLTLAAIGVLMQYSAAGGEWQPWAAPQLLRFVIGLIIMLTVALAPIRLLLQQAYLIYALCVGLLLMVEVIGFVGMGAQRWLSVGGVSLQPSELTKLATILALARYFHQAHAEQVSRLIVMLPALLILALPVALILLQPNLGTATILTLIGGAMLFMAGLRWWYFALVVGAGLAAAPIGWQFLHDYQKQRVMTFLDPSKDPLGAGYNITQSMIAIGSGGVSGKGILQGSQAQLDFLPEKQTDFIFTMLAEETGFIGAALVVALFAALLALALGIAVRSRHRFGALLAVGIAAMIFAHLMINIAMVMGLVPVVGVPLPFLSYGGSFLIASMLGIGLLLNAYVNRDARLERHKSF